MVLDKQSRKTPQFDARTNYVALKSKNANIEISRNLFRWFETLKVAFKMGIAQNKWHAFNGDIKGIEQHEGYMDV